MGDHGSPSSWRISLSALGLSDLTKKRADVGRQGFGFLQGSEVPAGWHRRPALDIVDTFGPGAGRRHNFPRKGSVGGRHRDTRALRNRPCRMTAIIVRPESRVDGT